MVNYPAGRKKAKRASWGLEGNKEFVKGSGKVRELCQGAL